MGDLHSAVPFTFGNIRQGHRYTKNGTTIFPFSASDGIPVDHELLAILSKKSSRTVIEYDLNCVVKNGFEVQPAEAKAMRLVSKHTSVPVPEVYSTSFTSSRNRAIECRWYLDRLWKGREVGWTKWRNQDGFASSNLGPNISFLIHVARTMRTMLLLTVLVSLEAISIRNSIHRPQSMSQNKTSSFCFVQVVHCPLTLA